MYSAFERLGFSLNLPLVIRLFKAAGGQSDDTAVLVSEFYLATDQVCFGNSPRTVVISNTGTLWRNTAALLAVINVFVRKAAEEPSAGAGNFHRIERKVLLFRHFYRHRLKLVRKGVAAIAPAANTQAADKPGLVSNADLPQFYTAF